jgi:hypothetical protein
VVAVKSVHEQREPSAIDPLPEKSLILNWKVPRYFPRLGGAEGNEGIEVFGRAEGVYHPAG